MDRFMLTTAAPPVVAIPEDDEQAAEALIETTHAPASDVTALAAANATAKEERFTALRFPLIVVISLITAAITNTIAAEFTGLQFESVSRVFNQEWEAVLVLSWKVLELGFAWFSGFDDVDMVSFTLLTSLPHAYLLNTFYLIPAKSILLHYGSNMIANYLPFRVLRKRAPAHAKDAVSKELHPLTHDNFLTATTSLLGAITYVLPLYLSMTTWLPVHLIIHFSGLKTLDPAHSSSLPTLLIPFISIPIGYATCKYLFAPAAVDLISTMSTNEEDDIFDPETASLGETLAWNFFFWRRLPPRAREILKRTFLLAAWTTANTAFHGWAEVEGAEGFGALGYAGVWSAGAALTGVVLGWVGGAFTF